MSDRALGITIGRHTAKVINFNYTSALVTQKFFVAPWPCVVTHLIGIPRVAGTGGACSVQFFKVPNGIAVASGSLLHSGTYDLTGTVDTLQALAMSTDPTVLNLNPGDGIGYVLSGTATSAVGSMMITVENQA